MTPSTSPSSDHTRWASFGVSRRATRECFFEGRSLVVDAVQMLARRDGADQTGVAVHEIPQPPDDPGSCPSCSSVYISLGCPPMVCSSLSASTPRLDSLLHVRRNPNLPG